MKSKRTHPLSGINNALKRGEVVIIFPEGSRGHPEQLGRFKAGIAHIAKNNPQVPVIPVFMHGLGKALPKGEGLLVPFFLDIFIGEPLPWKGEKKTFLEELATRMRRLAAEGEFPSWD